VDSVLGFDSRRRNEAKGTKLLVGGHFPGETHPQASFAAAYLVFGELAQPAAPILGDVAHLLGYGLPLLLRREFG